MLKINEIFYSIQGESSFNGMPCVFIRLTYCNLRCSYCDTDYAFHEGSDMSINQIIQEIQKYDCNLIEVTGGEPLMQKESIELMQTLINKNYQVMLETGGSLPIKKVPKEVIKIIDFKCPTSNMEKKNDWSIIQDLNKNDEIKFVIGDKEDYKWAKEKIKEYDLYNKKILFSPVHNVLDSRILSEWILKDNLKVRLQIQLHKYIWSPETKGV